MGIEKPQLAGESSQEKIDPAKNTLIEEYLAYLETISKSGVLPTDEDSIKTITTYLQTINDHRELLQKELNKQPDDTTKKQLQKIDVRCEELMMWRRVHASKGTVKEIADYISEYLTFLGLNDLAENLIESAENLTKWQSLDRAIRFNPEINMAMNTYKILRAHSLTRFSEKDAEFILAVEVQLKRGIKALQDVDKSYKFIFSKSAGGETTTLNVTKRLINERKEKVVEALKNSVITVLVSRKSTDSDFDQFLKKIADRSPSEESNKEVHALRAVQLLNQLKDKLENGQDNPESTLNIKIDQHIKEITEKYKEQTGEALDIDKTEQILLSNLSDEILSKKLSEEKTKLNQIFVDEINKRLLSGHILDEEIRKTFIDTINIYVKSLTIIIHDKEIKKYQDDLDVIHRIYTDPQNKILVRNVSESSELFELNKLIEDINNVGNYAKENEQAVIELVKAVCSFKDTESLPEILKKWPKIFDKKEAQKQKAKEQFDQLETNKKNVLVEFSPIVQNKSLDLTSLPSDQTELNAKLEELSRHSQEIEKRHEIASTWFSEKKHLNSKFGLNPRSAHFIDFTPWALKTLIERLNILEDIVKINFPSDEKTQMLNDIEFTRQEIAMSLFERLRLFKENKVLDLVAYYHNLHVSENQKIQASTAYQLTRDNVSEYVAFIKKYGDKRLREELFQNEFVTESEIYLKRTKQLSEAFERYFSAVETNVQEIEEKAALHLSTISAWLPQRKACKTDAEYCAAVKKALLPTFIAAKDSPWQKMIENQKKILVDENSSMERNEKTEVAKVQKKLSIAQQSLEDRKKSWFFNLPLVKWVYKLFRSDPLKSKQQDVLRFEKKLEDANETLEMKTASLTVAARYLKKHIDIMLTHVIKNIRDEILSDNEMTLDRVRNVVNFVETEGNEAHKNQLQAKLDFTQQFIDGIASSENIEELEKIAKCIGVAESRKNESLNRVIALIKGDSQYKIVDVVQHLKSDLENIIQKSTENDGFTIVDVKSLKAENVEADILFEEIKRNYLDSRIKEILQGSDVLDNEKKTDSLKKLLDFYSFEEKKEKMDALKTYDKTYLLPLINVFKGVEGYEAFRKDAFSFFESHISVYLKQDALKYTLDNFNQDNKIFEWAENAKLDSELSSVVKIVFNEAMNKMLLLSEEQRPKWNENIACLVEQYGDDAVKGQYRLMRMKELVQESMTVSDKITEEIAFHRFMLTTTGDATKVADYVRLSIKNSSGEEPLILKESERLGELTYDPIKFNKDSPEYTYISTLAKGENASWMHEIIVSHLGMKEELQNMHATWMMRALAINDRNNNVDAILEKLFEIDNINNETKLESFIGKDNSKKVKEKFQSMISLSQDNTVSPVSLFGDINAIEALDSKKVETVRTLGGRICEVFCRIYNIPSTEQINAYVTSLKSQKDLTVLAAEYLHNVITENYFQKLSEPHIETIKNYLLMTPKERAELKEQKRSELAESNQVTQDVDKKKSLEEGFDVVEMFELKQAATGTSSPYEYNYINNPQSFYKYYLAPVQEMAIRAIKGFFLNIFIGPPPLSMEEITSRLSQFEQQMIMPLTPFHSQEEGERYIKPLIPQESKDEKLSEYLITIGADNATSNDLQQCLAYVKENFTKIPPAIEQYITCCEKANQLRNMRDSAYICLALEGAMSEMERGQWNIPSLQDLCKNIKQNKFLHSFTSFKERIMDLKNSDGQSLLTILLNTCHKEIQSGKVEMDHIQIVAEIAQVFGDDAQKQNMERICQATEIISNITKVDLTPVRSDNQLLSLITTHYVSLLKVVDVSKGGYLQLLCDASHMVNTLKDQPFFVEISQEYTRIVLDLIKRGDINLLFALKFIFDKLDIRALLDKQKIRDAILQCEHKDIKKAAIPFLKDVVNFMLTDYSEYNALIEQFKNKNEAVTSIAVRAATKGVGRLFQTQDPEKLAKTSLTKKFNQCCELTNQMKAPAQFNEHLQKIPPPSTSFKSR